jgi:hypothetical protein
MIPKRVKQTQNEKRSPRNHNLELLLLPYEKNISKIPLQEIILIKK